MRLYGFLGRSWSNVKLHEKKLKIKKKKNKPAKCFQLRKGLKC